MRNGKRAFFAILTEIIVFIYENPKTLEAFPESTFSYSIEIQQMSVEKFYYSPLCHFLRVSRGRRRGV